MVELLINLQRAIWNQENSKLLDRANVQDRIDSNPAPNVLSVLDTISTLPRKISNVKPLDIISREFWKFYQFLIKNATDSGLGMGQGSVGRDVPERATNRKYPV